MKTFLMHKTCLYILGWIAYCIHLTGGGGGVNPASQTNLLKKALFLMFSTVNHLYMVFIPDVQTVIKLAI